MKPSLHTAKKLQQLLLPNQTLPYSEMANSFGKKMLQDGILLKKQISNTKAVVYILQKEAVAAYLQSHCGINNLNEYIEALSMDGFTRAKAIEISSNSKLKSIRTFKGFLVNCYEPIKASLEGKEIVLQPADGSFTFISDCENFRIDEDVTIVGVENAENFKYIKRQAYLFNDIKPLFVCRYPQSNDLIKWLSAIPNAYLHFGDLDFSGIGIYMSEYKKTLGARARFFVPQQVEAYLQKYGSKHLYNKQYSFNNTIETATENSIVALLKLFDKYKKVLEQEIFIIQDK